MKVLLAALFLAAFPFLASAEPAEAPKAVAGFIAETSGSVQIQLGGSDIWMLAKPGQRLTPGSQVKTQAGSSCVIGFTEGSKLRIGPNANFKLEETTSSKIAVFLGLGKLDAWISKMAKRSFQARNPVAVASVRGTILGMNVLSPTNATTDCYEGSLAVTDNFGRTTALGEGSRMETSAATGSSAPAPLPPNTQKPAEPKVDVPQNIKDQVKAEDKKAEEKKNEDKKEEKAAEKKKEEAEPPPEEVQAEAPPPSAPPTSPTQETTTTPVSPSSP